MKALLYSSITTTDEDSSDEKVLEVNVGGFNQASVLSLFTAREKFDSCDDGCTGDTVFLMRG